MESEVQQTRVQPAHTAAGDVDPRLLSYRNWALQTDLNAVLELPSDLRRPADLGLSGDTATSQPGGQGELERELEPDPEIGRRTLYALMLWGTALITDLLNQFGPIGQTMTSPTAELEIAGILAAMIYTAIVYPRTKGSVFAIAEQGAVAFAYLLITFQCADTGGVESPYTVWWLYALFYSASFFPARRAYANSAMVTVLVLAPALYDESFGEVDAITRLLLLITLVWTLSASIIASRELERGAERAARFTALADPLTGVANQRSISRMIDAATRGGQSQFGLVLVDMNGLKGANAAFGFSVGDAMLIRLTGLLRHASDTDAQVARIRGEEFAVYLPGAGRTDVARWRDRFDAILVEHNAWVRNRMPQISVNVASVVYPIDGARASQLFERAVRDLVVQRESTIEQPHEVTVSTVPGADRLIGSAAVAPAPRLRGFVGATRQLAVRWAFGALLFGLYAAAGGAALTSAGGMTAVAATCAVLSVICLSLRGSRLNAAVTTISDVASIVLILPILWSSGGWQSPLVLIVYFPIVYYGQFLRGRRAYLRAAALLASFTVAFWGAGIVGAIDAPVSPAGEALYVALLVSLLVLTFLLQASHNATDSALRKVNDAATRDPLTGLRNVHAMRDELQALIDNAAFEPSADAPIGASGPMPRPAVTIADIDDFRGLIYRHGHKAGDEVLLAVTQRLEDALGGMANAFHIERDEFAVVYRTESEAQAVETTKRVEQAILDHPERQPRLESRLRFTFGTAVWRPGSTVASMVDEASAQLAAARAGRQDGDASGGKVVL